MKLFLKIIFAAFLVFIICFNFQRYYCFPLDGDLPAIVLPVYNYETVMKDPLGLNVIFHDSVYAATNRFFTHFSLMVYFKNVPLWLQHFFSPIDSIYIACAIAKTLIHFLLVYLIAIYVTNKKKIWDIDVLLVAVISTPFFQTNGYYVWMGIIDHSITYAFFYSLAISLVFLFFLPFFNAGLGRRNFNFSWLKIVVLIILIVVISFNGPLNAPVVLLICASVLIHYFLKNYINHNGLPFKQRLAISFKNIPSSLMTIFTVAIVIGLYSYYIGRNNSENFWLVMPISERYMRLFQGFWYQYTNKLGQPLLIAAIIINAIIIGKLKPNEEGIKIRKFLKWFAILSVIYILLLPLGGYRAYRENIIRFDTILPVTLGLILFYCYSSFYIIKYLQGKFKNIYLGMIIIISGIYFNSDAEFRNNSACEREAIEKIAKSDERIVFIDNQCSVLNWGRTLSVGESRIKTDLLLYWNVLREQKLYYQK